MGKIGEQILNECPYTECVGKKILTQLEYQTVYNIELEQKNMQLQIEIKVLREITNIKDPEQHFEQIMTANKQLQAELVLLAKLASDKPEFFNPMEAMRAKELRDKILKS